MRQVKAFTLIELLVVVAIISLLVAMLLPTLGQARELAKTSLCLTSLRELGISSQMYGDAYNDFMPGSVEHHCRGWQQSLEKAKLLTAGMNHTNDPIAIYGCPNYVSPLKVFPGWNACSYGHNALAISGVDTNGWGAIQLRFAQVARPSDFFVYCDFYNLLNDAYEYPWDPTLVLEGSRRHGVDRDKTNISWADGHASTTTPEEFYDNSSRYFNPGL